MLNPRPQSLEGRGGVWSSSQGQGAGEVGEEAESPEAVSAGLALTQDVRTLAPGEARAPEPGGQGPKEGASQRAFGAKGGSSDPWSPLPMSTPPWPPAVIHSHPHSLHTQAGAAKALDPHPGPQECLWIGTQRAGPRQRVCKGGGSSVLLLIGGLTGIYPITIHVHWF